MSAPYSVMMIGLPSPAHRGQLFFPGQLSPFQVAGVDVPAVVAVQHQHVPELGDPALAVRGEHDVHEPDRAGGVGFARDVEERAEVVLCAFGVGLGFVGDAPDHDARVVLVSGDQFPDGLGVHLSGGVVHGLGRKRHVALATEDAAPEAHIETHRSRFVDQHDALPVGVVDDVFGVRVVRRTERIRADPLQQLEVVQQVGVVVAFTDHRQVLMLAEPSEVERLVVDQEPDSVHLDGAHPDTLVIAVYDGVPVQSAAARGHRGSRRLEPTCAHSAR